MGLKISGCGRSNRLSDTSPFQIKDATTVDTSSFARLLMLAAIWGGSFLFMRIGAPVIGPAILVELRVIIAAVFLAIVGRILHESLDIRLNWKHYLILGLFNTGLPFFLVGFAAQILPASLLSILSAMSPIFGSVIEAIRERKWPSLKVLAGLMLGVFGVGLLVGSAKAIQSSGYELAITAALTAALSYGIASSYAQSAKAVAPLSSAHGSMWAAALLVAPALPFFPESQAPTIGVSLAIFSLGLLSTGIAYLFYFRLINEVGSTSALTVTFLIPVFGTLWGVLFLSETVTWHTLVGAGIVLVGTGLVTGLTPKLLWVRETTS
jgi:drug/metabolite transporter (DMT)-like permease